MQTYPQIFKIHRFKYIDGVNKYIYILSLPHLCPEISVTLEFLLQFQSGRGKPSAVKKALQRWDSVQAVRYRHPDLPGRKLKNKTKHFLLSENLKDPLILLFPV